MLAKDAGAHLRDEVVDVGGRRFAGQKVPACRRIGHVHQREGHPLQGLLGRAPEAAPSVGPQCLLDANVEVGEFVPSMKPAWARWMVRIHRRASSSSREANRW